MYIYYYCVVFFVWKVDKRLFLIPTGFFLNFILNADCAVRSAGSRLHSAEVSTYISGMSHTGSITMAVGVCKRLGLLAM